MEIYAHGRIKPNGTAECCIVGGNGYFIQHKRAANNNKAQYQAFIEALRMAGNHLGNCTIYCDSLNIVGQINKGWVVPANLKEDYEKVKHLLKQLMYEGKSVTLVRIRKGKNHAFKKLEENK